MSATVPRPEFLPEPVPLTAATVRGWQAQRAEVDFRNDALGQTQSRDQGRAEARIQGWRPIRSRNSPMDTWVLRF